METALETKPQTKEKRPDERLFGYASQAGERVVRGQTVSTKNGTKVREALTTYIPANDRASQKMEGGAFYQGGIEALGRGNNSQAAQLF